MNNELLICTQTDDIFEHCFDDYEFLSKKYKLLADCGFEGVDLNLNSIIYGNQIEENNFSSLWDKSIEELYEYFSATKRASSENNIKIAQIHGIFPSHILDNQAVNDYIIMIIEKTLAVSKFLDCPEVVVHPYSNRDKEFEKKINLETYRRLTPTAKKYGVKVCLENMFFVQGGNPLEAACSSAEETCWYIDTLNKEAGEDIFGYCLDIGHATLLHKNIKHFILTLGNRLTCMHIHDNDGKHDLHLMPYTHADTWEGKLVTDWNGMLDGLKEIGYKGNISFETYMTFNHFPAEVHPEALKLLSAIGRHFKNKITEA